MTLSLRKFGGKIKNTIKYTWGIHSLTRKRMKTHSKKKKHSNKKRKSRKHKKRRRRGALILKKD